MGDGSTLKCGSGRWGCDLVCERTRLKIIIQHTQHAVCPKDLSVCTQVTNQNSPSPPKPSLAPMTMRSACRTSTTTDNWIALRLVVLRLPLRSGFQLLLPWRSTRCKEDDENRAASVHAKTSSSDTVHHHRSLSTGYCSQIL